MSADIDFTSAVIDRRYSKSRSLLLLLLTLMFDCRKLDRDYEHEHRKDRKVRFGF